MQSSNIINVKTCCIICQYNFANYNYIGEKYGIYCNVHRLFDMVYIKNSNLKELKNKNIRKSQ